MAGAKSSKRCFCIRKINRLLEASHNYLVTPITFRPNSPRVMVRTAKQHDSPRGTKVVNLVASFCPFCGKEYEP